MPKSTQTPNEDIENRFTYHPPKKGQPEQYTRIRERAKALAYELDYECPPSREHSLALTKLEEAVFWANAAIARHGEAVVGGAEPEAKDNYGPGSRSHEKAVDGKCAFSGPGRGDCEHFVGLPGKSIPGVHDGPDDTVDVRGKPNGWCQRCWDARKLEKLEAENSALRRAVVDASPVDALKQALLKDRDYLLGWHTNIACAVEDARGVLRSRTIGSMHRKPPGVSSGFCSQTTSRSRARSPMQRCRVGCKTTASNSLGQCSAKTN